MTSHFPPLTSQEKKTIVSCFNYGGPDAPQYCRNLIDLLPMSKKCRNMQKYSKNPWSGTPDKRKCDLQQIESFKRMNVSMADSLCASMPKHKICSSPMLAKMCTGDWFCKR
jgi:hypothetical protein